MSWSQKATRSLCKVSAGEKWSGFVWALCRFFVCLFFTCYHLLSRYSVNQSSSHCEQWLHLLTVCTLVDMKNWILHLYTVRLMLSLITISHYHEYWQYLQIFSFTWGKKPPTQMVGADLVVTDMQGLALLCVSVKPCALSLWVNSAEGSTGCCASQTSITYMLAELSSEVQSWI